MVSASPYEDLGREGTKRKRYSVAKIKGNWQNSDDDKLIKYEKTLYSNARV